MNTKTAFVVLAIVVLAGAGYWAYAGKGPGAAPSPQDTSNQAQVPVTSADGVAPGSGGIHGMEPERVSVVGYWECLPKKGPGPHTAECAFGIALDQSDGHLAINTALMSTYPVDYPTGTKLRVSGVIHPAEPTTSYDIDGVLWATTIEKI